MGRFVWDAEKNKAIPLSEVNTELEQGETLAPAVSEKFTSDNDAYEEQLAALAAANGIDISGKSRRQVENLLKKAGVDCAK